MTVATMDLEAGGQPLGRNTEVPVRGGLPICIIHSTCNSCTLLNVVQLTPTPATVRISLNLKC